jgi:hypothetical protein
VGVVDRLELVDVTERDREAVPGSGRVVQGGGEPVDGLVTVEQSGQVVTLGALAQQVLTRDLGVDLAQGSDQPLWLSVLVEEGPVLASIQW